MRRKKVALVGYSPRYFTPFGRFLETRGFDVYWITDLGSAVRELRTAGFADGRILFVEPPAVKRRFIPPLHPLLAFNDAVRPADIVRMDRLLRRMPEDYGLQHIERARQIIAGFLTSHDIPLVSSGRDTGLQLASMLAAQAVGSLWVVPTRMRIPQERYGFTATFNASDFVPIGDALPNAKAAAAEFLNAFRTRHLRPALRATTGRGSQFIRLLPRQIKVFSILARNAIVDRENMFARYSVGELTKRFFRRRRSYLERLLGRIPFQRPAQRPFILYALHTQPESSIDVVGYPFLDQARIVRAVAEAAPDGYDVYVKGHPADADGRTAAEYRSLLAHDRVRLLDPWLDSRELVRNAAVTVTVSGTIGFEAAMLRRPALIFADVFFSTLPGVQLCRSLEDVPKALGRALNVDLPVSDDELLDEIAYMLTHTFEGEVNRITQPLTSSDLNTLEVAYNRLYAYASTTGRSISSVAY